MNLQSRIVATEKFSDSLLCNVFSRRLTEDFCAPNFVEHVTQSLLYALDIRAATVVLNSDGRHRCSEAMDRAARVLAGNAVRRVLVDDRSSTSVATCLLRARHAHLALVFTGGHHPAKEYLGVKVLSPPGIPMRKEVLEKANQIALILESYQTCEDLQIHFEGRGRKEYFVSERPFTVEMLSAAPLYAQTMSHMFDFASIKEYLKKASITLTVDCSHGATGTTVLDILRNRLQVPEQSILNAESLEDFGGLSADPNPATRADFLELIRENKIDVGIVMSPAGSRCLLVGEDGFVVAPSDTLAIVADLCRKSVPFFRANPLKGMVCSMCTSQASDKVSKYSSLLCFVVLPGWDPFGPAMLSAPNSSIVFGEECSAVGVSSCSYCSDKDAVWTMLSWLSILANTKKTVKEVVTEHWKKFGRNVMGRIDFKNLPLTSLDSFMNFLKDTYTLRLKRTTSGNSKNVTYRETLDFDPRHGIGETQERKTIEDVAFDIDNYVHPFGFVRKSLLRNDASQIYQISQMAKDTRVIIRRSESILNSTTLRFYVEVCLEPEDDRIFADRKEILEPYISTALKIMKVREFFGENIKPVIV